MHTNAVLFYICVIFFGQAVWLAQLLCHPICPPHPSVPAMSDAKQLQECDRLLKEASEMIDLNKDLAKLDEALATLAAMPQVDKVIQRVAEATKLRATFQARLAELKQKDACKD